MVCQLCKVYSKTNANIKKVVRSEEETMLELATTNLSESLQSL